jgi:methionyl-tRNA synthetase
VGGDGDFSYDSLANRVNHDLANDIGNLANRTLKMIQNYFDGTLPEKGVVEGGDQELVRFCQETVQLYRKNFDALQIGRALDNVWELISVANRYLVAHEPWILARDKAKRDRLGAVLYNAAETIRIIALLLAPIVPDGVSSILRQLGLEGSLEKHRLASLTWGKLMPGSELGEVEAVFPRLEPENLKSPVELKESEKRTGKKKVRKPEKKVKPIAVEDFAKVEMRVGSVLSAERVPKSSKLLVLQVDIGFEKRQVVAGIGKAYKPEELVGKLVVVVTNLKKAKLMGVESNGMIVAASEEGAPVLATFDGDVALGSRLT